MQRDREQPQTLCFSSRSPAPTRTLTQEATIRQVTLDFHAQEQRAWRCAPAAGASERQRAASEQPAGLQGRLSTTPRTVRSRPQGGSVTAGKPAWLSARSSLIAPAPGKLDGARDRAAAAARDWQDVSIAPRDSQTLPATSDATREPIDLLPLRPWEVRKVRERLAKMRSEPPPATREARMVLHNIVEANRAALAEYEAAPSLARLRRGSKRLQAIRSRRPRSVGGLRVIPRHLGGPVVDLLSVDGSRARARAPARVHVEPVASARGELTLGP